VIAGRPTNLWLGLATAIQGAVAITLVAAGFDPTAVATISGAWGGVVGALILIVANQPPTVAPGDTVKVTTPAGEPNYTIVARETPPPATVATSDAPPPPPDPGG